MEKMKKTTITIITSVMAMMANSATVEWSFAVYNSQSGIAPVSVTAYLYTPHDGIWVGDRSFNIDTLTLTDAIFGGEGYLPMGYPVSLPSTQVTPVSGELSKLTIRWSTPPFLDTSTDSPMNQFWAIVFVDDATSNYFGVQFIEFNNIKLGNQSQQRDDFHMEYYYPTLDLGWFQSVPEPSTALLALVGLAVFGLRRRKAR